MNPEKFGGAEEIKIVTLDEVNKFFADNPDVREEILGEEARKPFHVLSKEKMAEIFKAMGFDNAKLEEPKYGFFVDGGMEVKDGKWAEQTEGTEKQEGNEKLKVSRLIEIIDGLTFANGDIAGNLQNWFKIQEIMIAKTFDTFDDFAKGLEQELKKYTWTTVTEDREIVESNAGIEKVMNCVETLKQFLAEWSK